MKKRNEFLYRSFPLHENIIKIVVSTTDHICEHYAKLCFSIIKQHIAVYITQQIFVSTAGRIVVSTTEQIVVSNSEQIVVSTMEQIVFSISEQM